MKKYLLFAWLLTFSLLTYAQTDVQDSFWGVKFGARMPEVKRVFSEHATFIEDDAKTKAMVFTDGYFAGGRWDYVRTEFSYGTLYYVEFSNYYIDEQVAHDEYESYKSRLESKYSKFFIGETEEIKYDVDESNTYYIMFEGPRFGVSLSEEKSRSRSGSVYYYLTLAYYVRSVFNAEYNKNNSEL